MKAPSRPLVICSVALKCGWYMCVPLFRAVNSYLNESPGMTGSWVMTGTPSIALGTLRPWKCKVVGWSSLLCRITLTRSPRSTSIWGPGSIPLYAIASTTLSGSTSHRVSSAVNSKTLTPSIIRGLRGVGLLSPSS